MVNAVLGILFLATGTLATFLMYHCWGYPYDKEKHQSSAPQSLVFIHRILGYTYIGIYIYLMIQMVPRMWMYQVELPARTVVHLVAGILIGAILIIKLMIVRFFRHLEGTLVPALGTSLLLLTVVVISLSVPFAIRESMLNAQALTGVGAPDNLKRVGDQLRLAKLDDEGLLAQLTTSRGLSLGRKVLYDKCVTCHDLRLVMSKPRTGKGWRSEVKRMAKKANLFNPISDTEQWQVTAYLIAINSDLQASVEDKSASIKNRQEVIDALKEASGKKAEPAVAKTPAKAPEQAPNVTPDPGTQIADNSPPKSATGEPAAGTAGSTPETTAPPETAPAKPPVAEVATYEAPAGYVKAEAKTLFELKCTDCHAISKVEKNPPGDLEEVRDLVARMAEKDDGIEATKEEFEILIYYLFETYANQ